MKLRKFEELEEKVQTNDPLFEIQPPLSEGIPVVDGKETGSEKICAPEIRQELIQLKAELYRNSPN